MQLTTSILAFGLSVSLANAAALFGIQVDSNNDCTVRLDNFPDCAGANTQSFGSAVDGVCSLIGSYLTVEGCEGEVTLINDDAQNVAYTAPSGFTMECSMYSLNVGNSCDASTVTVSSSAAAATATA